jgi:hypothetical protein
MSKKKDIKPIAPDSYLEGIMRRWPGVKEKATFRCDSRPNFPGEFDMVLITCQDETVLGKFDNYFEMLRKCEELGYEFQEPELPTKEKEPIVKVHTVKELIKQLIKLPGDSEVIVSVMLSREQINLIIKESEEPGNSTQTVYGKLQGIEIGSNNTVEVLGIGEA